MTEVTATRTAAEVTPRALRSDLTPPGEFATYWMGVVVATRQDPYAPSPHDGPTSQRRVEGSYCPKCAVPAVF